MLLRNFAQSIWNADEDNGDQFAQVFNQQENFNHDSNDFREASFLPARFISSQYEPKNPADVNEAPSAPRRDESNPFAPSKSSNSFA